MIPFTPRQAGMGRDHSKLGQKIVLLGRREDFGENICKLLTVRHVG